MKLADQTVRGNLSRGAASRFRALLICLLAGSVLHARSHGADPSPEDLNQAIGLPLFGEVSLWEEGDDLVANRVEWGMESRTSSESGYRLYPRSEMTVFGVRPFSLFLQGVGGKVARISMIFANKGDVSAYASEQDRQRVAQPGSREMAVSSQMMQAYQAAIRHDEKELREALTKILGPSKPAKLGKVAGMDERGERWDWRGHTILLSTPRNEYVALRVVSGTVFDDLDAERRSFMATKALIPSRVEHRSNGDVVITDMPMVDQGAKGYCVPATFERVLRYYGLQADMNLLAMSGQTSAGGGTRLSNIYAAAQGLVREAGGRITSGFSGAKVADVQPYIDKGQPVLWALYSSEEFNRRLSDRMALRSTVTDWKGWKDGVLAGIRPTANRLPRNEGAHVCLITGYNRETREIAISDSWGPAFSERWLTEEEAQAVNQGDSSVIGW